MSRLLEQYKSKIATELKKDLGIANIYAVPKIQKIAVSVGVGRILQQNPKALDGIVESVQKITGQRPIITRAAKAIAGFKIRQGQVVGLAVTLRGQRMYDFLDKLVNVALPRTRDFRGVPRKGFDGRGNYSMGLREQIVFPEMSEEGMSQSFGMQVTISTTAKTDEQAYQLLKKFNFPFSEERKNV